MYRRRLLHVAIALATGVFVSLPTLGASAGAAKGTFLQTNLVTDNQDLAKAKFTDPSLKNPWGISSSPASPMWVSDNNAGLTTLYGGEGTKPPFLLTGVAIPPAPGSPPKTLGSPTGTVFNPNSVFSGGTDFGGDAFLFATEDGTIAGWQPADGMVATTEVDNSMGGSGAVYKGLAIGFDGVSNHLYASNFRSGAVEVLKSDFSPAASFTDPKIAAGYAPFGIQNLGGVLYVTYAMQNAAMHDDVAGQGHGFVDAFDMKGNLLDRLVSHGQLNSPWGLAIAPASFGAFAGDLLVGNFGDGQINAYTLDKGNFRGQLMASSGPIVIDGLWGLRVGNGGGPPFGGDPKAVYFTAGINHEADGLFGTITNANG